MIHAQITEPEDVMNNIQSINSISALRAAYRTCDSVAICS